jgi:hypothetical protein
MDNGLIFPYPRVFDKDEAHDTNHPSLPGPSGRGGGAWGLSV